MSQSFHIFDRQTVKQHRDRAAQNNKDSNFLFKESANSLIGRLDDISRTFSIGLNLGCRGQNIAATTSKKHRKIKWIETDLSPKFSKQAKDFYSGTVLAMDEELLAFKQQTFDLVVSNLSFHWVNDLPGTFKQILQVLKPNGLFLASFLGEETLFELRQSLVQAEVENENGLSPRISTFTELKTAGDLLVRAGFALPVADIEKIVVSYADPFQLMKDLGEMGESNSTRERRKTFCKRSTLMRAAQIYQETFGTKDGRIPATFDMIYLIGWSPHESQQQPMEKGSAEISLKTVLAD